MVATSDAVARVRYVSLLTTAAMIAFAANSVLCRAALGGGEIDTASFSAIRLLSRALAHRGHPRRASGSAHAAQGGLVLRGPGTPRIVRLIVPSGPRCSECLLLIKMYTFTEYITVTSV